MFLLRCTSYVVHILLWVSVSSCGMKEKITERFPGSLPILRFWILIQGLVMRGESVPEGKPSRDPKKEQQDCLTGVGGLRHAGAGLGVKG